MDTRSPGYLNWLQGIKTGDIIKVELGSGYSSRSEKHTVDSLTPKRIRVKVNERITIEIDRDTGRVRGSNWNHIYPWTIVDQRKQDRVAMKYRLKKMADELNLSKVSDANLEALEALLTKIAAEAEAEPKP